MRADYTYICMPKGVGGATVLPQWKVAEREVAQRQEAKSHPADLGNGAAIDKP